MLNSVPDSILFAKNKAISKTVLCHQRSHF